MDTHGSGSDTTKLQYCETHDGSFVKVAVGRRHTDETPQKVAPDDEPAEMCSNHFFNQL